MLSDLDHTSLPSLQHPGIARGIVNGVVDPTLMVRKITQKKIHYMPLVIQISYTDAERMS